MLQNPECQELSHARTSYLTNSQGHFLVLYPELLTTVQHVNQSLYIYSYTQQLCRLNSFVSSTKNIVSNLCPQIVTPLRWEPWHQALLTHPDRVYVKYILDGISEGFRIGFDHANSPLRSSPGNMRSAVQNPQVVQDYLVKEQQAGRVIELPYHFISQMHISRFGVVPKSSQPGKWRLILDLSSPTGSSVNDGIAKHLCSMHYSTLDQAITVIAKKGPAALLAKIDIAAAYRIIPIHPEDRHLLGMSWKGQLFIDAQLPFGLRSAPIIFSAVADALEWIVYHQGITFCLHYLDDFLTVGSAASQECSHNMDILTTTCASLGVPLKLDKVEGPTTSLTFLGIRIDTIAGSLSLPQDKLTAYKAILVEWSSRKAAKKREVLSLIGKLVHACKVIKPGRTFLRRMIQVAASRSNLDHWIRLDKDFRSDLAWWLAFLEVWNGCTLISSFANIGPLDPQISFSSDASGSWGCGAAWPPHWIQCPWGEQWMDVTITAKELLPIVLACAIWGPHWSHKRVQCFCDNMAVVNIWASQTSRHPIIMHLLRCIHFVLAVHEVELSIQHVPGAQNTIADAISRNLAHTLQATTPLSPAPIPVPPSLWQMLVTVRPDWSSPHWSQLWREYLHTV